MFCWILRFYTLFRYFLLIMILVDGQETVFQFFLGLGSEKRGNYQACKQDFA